MVPNKGPSPKYHTVTGAFMSPHVVTRHKQDFLERYYALMASNRNGALPAFPRRPPWRVLLANRREASGRRLTNEDELVQMIREFDVPVSVANFEVFPSSPPLKCSLALAGGVGSQGAES